MFPLFLYRRPKRSIFYKGWVIQPLPAGGAWVYLSLDYSKPVGEFVCCLDHARMFIDRQLEGEGKEEDV